MHARIILFADDMKLVKIVGEMMDSEKLQSDIHGVMEWCEANHLFFNKKKCFTAYRTTAVYVLGDHVIERCFIIRDRGILLDPKFTFAYHIEQITAHARQVIGYILRVSTHLRR